MLRFCLEFSVFISAIVLDCVLIIFILQILIILLRINSGIGPAYLLQYLFGTYNFEVGIVNELHVTSVRM